MARRSREDAHNRSRSLPADGSRCPARSAAPARGRTCGTRPPRGAGAPTAVQRRSRAATASAFGRVRSGVTKLSARARPARLSTVASAKVEATPRTAGLLTTGPQSEILEGQRCCAPSQPERLPGAQCGFLAWASAVRTAQEAWTGGNNSLSVTISENYAVVEAEGNGIPCRA
jgi:hypothetical protein